MAFLLGIVEDKIDFSCPLFCFNCWFRPRLRQYYPSSNNAWLTTVTDEKENQLEGFGITHRFSPEYEPHFLWPRMRPRQLLWSNAFFPPLLLLVTVNEFLLDTDLTLRSCVLLKSALWIKAVILHHGLNTLNYNFVTFPRQGGWLFVSTILLNVIALAIVSKFAANNRP